MPPSWSVTYRFLLAAAVLGGMGRRETRILPARCARGLRFAAAYSASRSSRFNFNFVYRAEGFITSGVVAVVFALLLVPNAILSRLFPRPADGAAAARRLGGRGGGRLAPLPPRDPRRSARPRAARWPGSASPSSASCPPRPPTSCRQPRPRSAIRCSSTTAVAMLIGALRRRRLCAGNRRPAGRSTRAGAMSQASSISASSPRRWRSRSIISVLRAIGPAKAAYSSVIVPVIAMLLSTAFEGYRWTLARGRSARGLAGVGLVIALTARRPSR